jgi:GDP-D-mannose 3', 5'-epimerase
MRTALVFGAGGFIAHHLVRRLKSEGYWVRGVDLKFPRFSETEADDFVIGDLRQQNFVGQVVDQRFDEVYQLAADMGGAGYIFTGDHDADVMHNSAAINLNVLDACYRRSVRRIFYSSSACMYPEYNQRDPENPKCSEDSAYPAAPDSEYGKEKAPAALCRKVAQAQNGGEIEIWGDGGQTRSFLYIDECVEGTLRLMRSDWTGPVNIGSEEMVTIDKLVETIAAIAVKEVRKRHIPGPTGVRGRNSDNRLIRERLGWLPEMTLRSGLQVTYEWIERQVMQNARVGPGAHHQ